MDHPEQDNRCQTQRKEKRNCDPVGLCAGPGRAAWHGKGTGIPFCGRAPGLCGCELGRAWAADKDRMEGGFRGIRHLFQLRGASGFSPGTALPELAGRPFYVLFGTGEGDRLESSSLYADPSLDRDHNDIGCRHVGGCEREAGLLPESFAGALGNSDLAIVSV